MTHCPQCHARMRRPDGCDCGAVFRFVGPVCPFCSAPIGDTYPQRCECGATFDYQGDPGTPAKSRGLGDVVAKVLHAAGITKSPGCGCAERQITLNRVFGR